MTHPIKIRKGEVHYAMGSVERQDGLGGKAEKIGDRAQANHQAVQKGCSAGRSKVRDAKNNEAHGAMKKERHVCASR
jgi:hypothetical protein